LEDIMPTLPVFNTSKEEVTQIDLSEDVFGAEVREWLFYDAVRYQLAKRRSGNHAVKSRAQVSGGGKKPFRQKGTGRARAGTTRAVHWRGGGVVHGPQVRSHAHKMNKKARRAALVAALSRRCEEGSLTILEAFQMDAPKTKEFIDLMTLFEWNDVLVITGEDNSKGDAVYKSAKNIDKVTVLPAEGLNVYDILKHQNLVLTKGAVDAVMARLG
jgi:large subunit ribosomal protein L4